MKICRFCGNNMPENTVKCLICNNLIAENQQSNYQGQVYPPVNHNQANAYQQNYTQQNTQNSSPFLNTTQGFNSNTQTYNQAEIEAQKLARKYDEIKALAKSPMLVVSMILFASYLIFQIVGNLMLNNFVLAFISIALNSFAIAGLIFIVINRNNTEKFKTTGFTLLKVYLYAKLSLTLVSSTYLIFSSFYDGYNSSISAFLMLSVFLTIFTVPFVSPIPILQLIFGIRMFGSLKDLNEPKKLRANGFAGIAVLNFVMAGLLIFVVLLSVDLIGFNDYPHMAYLNFYIYGETSHSSNIASLILDELYKVSLFPYLQILSDCVMSAFYIITGVLLVKLKNIICK